MQDKPFNLTREQLYDLVWSKPATKLSQELGISDVAIAKICKKLHIPKPPLGYWRQIEVGRRIQPPALPPIKPGVRSEVTIYPNSAKLSLDSQSPEVQALIESERSSNQVVVAKELQNPHSLVAQVKELLEKAKPDIDGYLSALWGGPGLSMRVTPNTLHRALCIMDAILKRLETRGYSMEVSKKECSITRITIGEDRLTMRLSVRMDRTEKRPDGEKNSKSGNLSSYRSTYTPSGKLKLMIDEYCSPNYRRIWNDNSRRSLEEQLDDIIIGIVIVIESLKAKRIRQEEEERRLMELKRRRQEEERRRKYLQMHTEQWHKAQQMRAFLQACEESIHQRLGSIPPDSPEANWLNWAKGYVNGVDPLVNGSVEKIILNPSEDHECRSTDWGQFWERRR